MQTSVTYKNKSGDVFSLLLVLFFLIDYLQYFSHALRYVKYLCPVIFGVAYSFRTNKGKEHAILKKVQAYFKRIFRLYAVLYGINLILALVFNTVTARFFADTYFVIAPILSVFFLLPFVRIKNRFLYFKILFWGSVIGFALEQGPALIEGFSNFNLSTLFFDSESETESSFAFIFSFLFLFSVTERYSNQFKIISLILMILGSKRIVLLSVSFVLLIYVLLIRWKSLFSKAAKNSIALLFVAGSLVLVYIYFRFANGYFDAWIEKAFNMSANQLTQGRQFLYKAILDQFSYRDHFTGEGLGTVDNEVALLTAGREGGKITNLHSEILRNYIELGVVLFSVWIFYKLKWMLKNRFTLVALMLLFFTLTTDNILVYFECMFIMYLLILLSFLNERHFHRLQRQQEQQ